MDVAGKRKPSRRLANLVHDACRERKGRETACRVTGMNPAFLYVLEYGSHVHARTVAEGINVELDGILQEGV